MKIRKQSSLLCILSIFKFCFGGYFIYDWTNIVNQYANHSDRHHNTHGVEFPDWLFNYGTGRSVNKRHFEHKTSQFSLFKIMYERALIDHRRSSDPDNAESFLIPYDFGMDAMFLRSNGRMRKTYCPLAKDVTALLTASKYFSANWGHDHILIVSGNQNMNYFFNSPSCLSVLQACWNCTKISIDEYLFVAQNRSLEMANRGVNWHAVPFPSDYHFDSSAGIDNVAPWENYDQNRSTLISFFGSSRTSFRHSVASQIREALTIQCSNHSSYCVHGTYKLDHEHHELGGPNFAYRNALFCLQPPGDYPTRKSIFDSILSGCIPVLFHPLSAKYMYEWHLSVEEWSAIGIFYDSLSDVTALLNQSIDFVEKLREYALSHAADIAQKRRTISSIAFRLQYSLVHNRTGTVKVSSKHSEVSSVSPHTASSNAFVGRGGKQLDAYDITMRRVLAIHSGAAGPRGHQRTSPYVVCPQERGHGIDLLQSHDWCFPANSSVDPYRPPSLVDYFTQLRSKHTMKGHQNS